MDELHVSMSSGRVVVVAAADHWRTGALAVHRAVPNHGLLEGWRITHMATGLRASHVYGSKALAMCVAKALESLPWDACPADRIGAMAWARENDARYHACVTEALEHYPVPAGQTVSLRHRPAEGAYVEQRGGP